MAIFYGPEPIDRSHMTALDADPRVRVAAWGSFLDAEPGDDDR